MSKDIYVFIEQRDNKLEKVGIELLGKARELADDLGQKVVGMLIGENVKGEAEILFRHGADKAVVVEDPRLKEYLSEDYADMVYGIIKNTNPKSCSSVQPPSAVTWLRTWLPAYTPV